MSKKKLKLKLQCNFEYPNMQTKGLPRDREILEKQNKGTRSLSSQIEEMNEYHELFLRRVEEMSSIPGFTPNEDNIPPPLAVLYASTMVSPLRRLYSWAVPTTAALDEVAYHSTNGVVEIGAGYVHAVHRRRREEVERASAVDANFVVHFQDWILGMVA